MTQAVSEIIWTANNRDTAIKPGEFDQFNVSAGPLPTTPVLTFKALQTYSDGSVVSWIEEPAPGSNVEPDHPAPKLTLAPSDATDASGAPASGSGPTVTMTKAPASGASKGAATTGIVLGIVGVVIGAAGVALALASRRSRAAGHS